MTDAPPTDFSLAELLERVRMMEAALRPFAVLAQIYDRRPDDLRLISTAIGDITVGTLRTARRAVAD